MANTYTDLLKLRQPALGDTGWDDELNDNTAILEVLLAAIQKGNGVITGLAPSDGGSLDVDYTAGGVVVNGARKAVSASSKTCTANLKNWLYVDSSGVMQISTTAPTGQYVPVAMIDAGAAAISRIADLRILPRTPAVNVETLTADKTLAAGDICTRQILDPGGGDRKVLLPPEAEGWCIIYNAADAAETLTIKDDSDTDTIATVPQGGSAILLCDGTTWVKLENLKFAGDVVFDGSVSISGTLSGPTDPTGGTHVGDRDYNDGRYVQQSRATFIANITAQQANVTGDGTSYDATGAIWTETTDDGGCFSNGTFTATATRPHLFSGSVYLGGLSTANHTYCDITVVTSNGARLVHRQDITRDNTEVLTFARILDMDAADTATLRIYVGGSSKSVDIETGTYFEATQL